MRGDVFQVEALLIDTFGTSLKDKRTILNMRQHYRRDAFVVFDNVTFREALLWKDDLVQITFFHGASNNHRYCVSCCRENGVLLKLMAGTCDCQSGKFGRPGAIYSAA